jgi:hypothetical protein
VRPTWSWSDLGAEAPAARAPPLASGPSSPCPPSPRLFSRLNKERAAQKAGPAVRRAPSGAMNTARRRPGTARPAAGCLGVIASGSPAAPDVGRGQGRKGSVENGTHVQLGHAQAVSADLCAGVGQTQAPQQPGMQRAGVGGRGPRSGRGARRAPALWARSWRLRGAPPAGRQGARGSQRARAPRREQSVCRSGPDAPPRRAEFGKSLSAGREQTGETAAERKATGAAQTS